MSSANQPQKYSGLGDEEDKTFDSEPNDPQLYPIENLEDGDNIGIVIDKKLNANS